MIAKKSLIGLLLFLFLSPLVKAGPALTQLAINANDKTCFSFIPGDEHVSVYLKNPENWKTFPVGFNSQVSTSFGVCDYNNKTVNDCCGILGFKLLSNSEVEPLLIHKVYQDPSTSTDKKSINNHLKNYASTENSHLQKTDSFFENKNWFYYFTLLYIFAFLFILFKILKRIQNNNEEQTKNVALKLLVLLKVYPLICVLLVTFQSYFLVKADLGKLGIIAIAFLIGLNLIVVSISTSFTVLLNLAGVLYKKELFLAPLLIVNLYFSFNAHILIPKIFNIYRDVTAIPKVNKEKQLYSELMKTWPKNIDVSNLPEQIILLLRDDKKVEFRNLFPIKIYLTLKAKNLSKNKPAKYNPFLEFCQLGYEVPLNPQASATFDTNQCAFQIDKRGFSIMIRSDIGYSAISREEN